MGNTLPRSSPVPEAKNFDTIERIIRDVGEKELEIGMMPEPDEALGLETDAGGEAGEEEPTAGRAGAETAEGETGFEEESAERAPEGVPSPEGEDIEGEGEPLAEVLKDIEVGLSEEKELERKLKAGEDDFGLPLDFDMENLNVAEEPPRLPGEGISTCLLYISPSPRDS